MSDYYDVGADGRSNRILADTADPSVRAMQAEEIEDGETLDMSGITGIPREALTILLRFLLPTTDRAPTRWRKAQIRLACLAHITNVDGIGNVSLEQLAQELQCTRALLSMRTLQIIDAAGIEKTRSGKQRTSRAIYSASATASHERRGNKLSSQLLNAVDDR